MLSEFNHLCAICGGPRPQLHHIDSDICNHDPDNLIPLCPNHHLTDAHDPTQPIDSGLLALIREYRDPAVLDPRFQPIFKRLKLIKKRLASPPERPSQQWFHQAFEAIIDVWRFLRVFEKGAYYADEIVRSFGMPNKHDDVFPNQSSALSLDFMTKAKEPTFPLSKTEELLMEFIRYQTWAAPRS